MKLRSGRSYRAPVKKRKRNAGGVAKKAGSKKKVKLHRARKTRRNKKVDEKLEIAQHNDLSIHNCGVRIFGVQKPIRSKGIVNYQNLQQWVMTQSQGYQCVDFPEVILTRYPLTGLTSGDRTERYRLADDLFAVNPYSTFVPNTVFPAPAPEVSLSDLIHISKVNSKMQMLSLMNVPCIVKVYYCTPIYDTDINPIDCWNNVMLSKNLTQGAADHTNTLANVSTLPGYSQSIIVGQNPFIHKEFRKQWKCLSTVKVILQPGSQINYSTMFMYNRTISRSTLLSREAIFLRDITIFPLFIIQGGMVGLSEGSNLETQLSREVSYAPIKVGVIHDTMYEIKHVEVSRLSSQRMHDGLVHTLGDLTLRQIDDTDEKDYIKRA